MDVKDFKPNVVTVEIGGKTRTIKYDLNAFAELEKRYGTVEEAMKILETGSMSGIRTILWAGLIHEEVEVDAMTGEPVRYLISPYAVGSWITPSMLPVLTEKLMMSMGEGMPDPENMTDDVKGKLKDAGFELTKDGLARIQPTKEELEEKNV